MLTLKNSKTQTREQSKIGNAPRVQLFISVHITFLRRFAVQGFVNESVCNFDWFVCSNWKKW